MVEPELKAGLGEVGVEAGGLGEEAMLGGGVSGEEAADIGFEGVDADTGAFGEERSFVNFRVGEDLAEGAEAESALE